MPNELTGNYERPQQLSRKDQYHIGLEQDKALEADDRTLIGESISNQWVGSGLIRMAERAGVKSRMTPVEGYKVPEHELDALVSEFSQEERAYIGEAISPDDKQRRISNYREDKSRHQFIQMHGGTGIASEMVTGMLDPIGLSIGFMTGGSSILNSANRVVKTVGTATAVGLEALGTEALLTMSDTERQSRDIITTAGMSAIFGGALGALTKGKLSKLSDDMDVATRVDADNISRHTTVSHIDDGGTPTTVKVDDVDAELDTKYLRREVDNYSRQLDADAKTKAPRKQKKELNKKKEVLEKDLDEARALEVQHRAKVMASKGAAKNAAEQAVLDARNASIDAMYKPRIEKIESELFDVNSKLGLAQKQAQKEFNELPFSAQAEIAVGKEKIAEHVKAILNQKAKLKKVGGPIDAERIAKAKKIEAKRQANKAEAEGKESPVQKEGEVEEEYRPLFTGGRGTEEMLTDVVESMDGIPPSTSTLGIGKLPRFIRDKALSLYTTLDHSKNKAFRGLNRMLFESPQGGAMPQVTASILSHMHLKQIKSAVRNRYADGYLAWSHRNGRNVVASVIDVGDKRLEFDIEVYRHIKSGNSTDPDVISAADGLSDGFSLALKLRKEAGEAGFEHVKDLRGYIPTIFDGNKMNKAWVKFDEQTVIRALSKGYQTGGLKIRKSLADRVAKMQYLRTMEHTLTDSGYTKKAISEAERERFAIELEDAGVPRDVVEDFLSEKELSQQLDNVSNRARKTLDINVDAEVDGLSVHNLLNTNVTELSEAYFREAAGGAAMAKKGFKTYESAMQMLNAAERYGGRLSKEMKIESEMIKDGIDMIYGKTIEKNPNGVVEKSTRRLREMTSLLRLQQVGFAQIPESARMLHTLGLEAVMEGVPGTAFFKRRGIRGGTSAGEIPEVGMKELERHLGYIGEDGWLNSMYTRTSDWGEGDNASEALRVLDNALAAGGKVNMVTSGFQAIQGGMEKLVARGISHRLTKLADGLDEGLAKNLMKEVGWDDNFIARLKKHGQHFDEYNGEQIRVLGLDQMNPYLREEVLVGISRLQSRIIQKGFVGDSSIFMNKWLGKTLMQFRSFAMISLEKQLVHDIRGDKAGAAMIGMWGGLASFLTYSAKVHLNSFKEKDREEYLDNMLSPEMLAWGTFNMLPQTASVSLAGDVLATIGALPDQVTSTPGSRGGFRPIGGSNVAASAGTIGDAAKALSIPFDVMYGRGVADSDIRAGLSLTPFLNTMGIAQGAHSLINKVKE